MKNAIIIMTKVPAAGNVKTRLQPFLSAGQRVALAECFLLDTISKIESSRIPLIIAFSPIDKRDALPKPVLENHPLVGQKGAHLGEKMFNAFQFAFAAGLDSVVMLGTDSPTFPGEFIARAFELLSEKDAVLGETADGGFYLIGLRVLRKEIFENVEWSSPRTFGQTARNIEKLNLKLALLPDWYDVDTPDDLKILKKDLATNPDAAPKTYEFLEKFGSINYFDAETFR